MPLSKISANGIANMANGNLFINSTTTKNGSGSDGYDATRKFITLSADSGAADRGAFIEIVGTGGGANNYWFGGINFYTHDNPYAHARILSWTDEGSNTGSIVIATNTTANSSAAAQRWKFKSDGTLQGLTTDAGIQFTKSGSLTNSILNDYETGTFTPSIYQGSTQITSPTSVFGYYVKVGKLVWVNWYFYKSSGAPSATGAWQMRNLPFTTSGSYNFLPGGYLAVNSLDYFSGNGTNPSRWQLNSGSTADLYSAITSTSWTSGYLEMHGTGTYQTAS